MCYQCDSTQPGCTDDQTMWQSYKRPCAKFDYTDECYAYMDEATQVGYRGCLSDTSVGKDLCVQNEASCLKCDTNHCNVEFMTRDPEMMCIQCSETDPACAWQQDPTAKPLRCSAKVGPNDEESCYLYKYADGGVRRGCTLDDNFCDTHECKTCTTDNYCNAETVAVQLCVSCNSTESYYPTCEDSAEGLLATQCAVSPYYEDRGCYSIRDEGE